MPEELTVTPAPPAEPSLEAPVAPLDPTPEPSKDNQENWEFNEEAFDDMNEAEAMDYLESKKEEFPEEYSKRFEGLIDKVLKKSQESGQRAANTSRENEQLTKALESSKAEAEELKTRLTVLETQLSNLSSSHEALPSQIEGLLNKGDEDPVEGFVKKALEDVLAKQGSQYASNDTVQQLVEAVGKLTENFEKSSKMDTERKEKDAQQRWVSESISAINSAINVSSLDWDDSERLNFVRQVGPAIHSMASRYENNVPQPSAAATRRATLTLLGNLSKGFGSKTNGSASDTKADEHVPPTGLPAGYDQPAPDRNDPAFRDKLSQLVEQSFGISG